MNECIRHINDLCVKRSLSVSSSHIHLNLAAQSVRGNELLTTLCWQDVLEDPDLICHTLGPLLLIRFLPNGPGCRMCLLHVLKRGSAYLVSVSMHLWVWWGRTCRLPAWGGGGCPMLGSTCRCQAQLFWTYSFHIRLLPFSPCQNCLVEVRTVNSETDTENISGWAPRYHAAAIGNRWSPNSLSCLPLLP